MSKDIFFSTGDKQCLNEDVNFMLHRHIDVDAGTSLGLPPCCDQVTNSSE